MSNQRNLWTTCWMEYKSIKKALNKLKRELHYLWTAFSQNFQSELRFSKQIFWGLFNEQCSWLIFNVEFKFFLLPLLQIRFFLQKVSSKMYHDESECIKPIKIFPTHNLLQKNHSERQNKVKNQLILSFFFFARTSHARRRPSQTPSKQEICLICCYTWHHRHIKITYTKNYRFYTTWRLQVTLKHT